MRKKHTVRLPEGTSRVQNVFVRIERKGSLQQEDFHNRAILDDVDVVGSHSPSSGESSRHGDCQQTISVARGHDPLPVFFRFDPGFDSES